jgi:hypothetical protein
VIATSPAYHDRPPQRLLLNLPDTTSLLPGTLVGRDAGWVAAAAVFAASYLALAVGRVPGLAIDRAGVALVGACLMVMVVPIARKRMYLSRAVDHEGEILDISAHYDSLIAVPATISKVPTKAHLPAV